MKPIEELLKNLGRAEVLEFGLVTNRLPSVNIGGKFEPVDDEAPTTDVLLQMLVTMGGSRYVEQLSERPVQWTTRLDGVGVIAVAAIMRKDVVQARFTVARRDTGAGVSKAPPAPKDPVVVPAIAQQSRPAELRRTQQGTGGPQPTPAGVPAPAAQAPPPVPKPAAAGGGSPSAAAQPAAAPAGAGGGGSQSSAVQRAAAPQPQPQAASVKAAVAAPAHVASVPPAAGPLAGAVPPPDDWDDDDEPTVQTLSPPVAPPQLQQQQQAALAHAQTLQVPPGEEPKPKPARKPGEVAGQPAPAADDRKAADERRAIEERAAAEKKAAEERAAAEKRAADERSAAERKAAEERAASEKKAADERKAAEERAAAEKKAADERKAAEERAAHERKIIEERAAAERKAADDRKVAEERKLAEQRNAQERVNQERIVAERAAAEKRAAIERAAAERQVAAERLAAERKAAERAKVERRISTPTSVDAVDVEITTADSGSGTRPVAGDSAEVEVEIVDNTVELSPVDVAVARVATAAMPAHGVASAIPSTTPSAALLPEKDRPRADGALESFLALAVAARASDVHVVAGRPVLLRVATDLLPRTQPVLPEHVESIAREIVPGRLREALETDGSCDFAIDHPAHGRFRVNVSRQRTGYKLSMRVIPREIPTLAALALPDAVGAAAKYAQGLVLVTGPTGHGKTSTLAAIVDILNRDSSRHVLTIEDPVEFVHPRKRAMISQREVGTHARSFASALKASLREDPDVIVVGELRDPETVRMAIAASESGHLVIGSMNTPTAAKTIDRLIDMFPAAEQAQIRASVASVLRLVIGQRLVPSADRTRLHAAVEMLPSSIALYALIRDARTFQIPSLQQRGRTLGVIRLDESLAELVRSQKVTLEVAKQFAESPQELEAYSTRNISAAVARKG